MNFKCTTQKRYLSWLWEKNSPPATRSQHQFILHTDKPYLSSLCYSTIPRTSCIVRPDAVALGSLSSGSNPYYKKNTLKWVCFIGCGRRIRTLTEWVRVISATFTLFRMVRVMGLEPIRQRHTPLKRACLPIPALPHLSNARVIISKRFQNVNTFLKIFLIFLIIFGKTYFIWKEGGFLSKGESRFFWL